MRPCLSANRLESFEKVQFVYFDRGFVAGLAEVLNRSNDLVQWQVAENVIGVALGERVFETGVNLV